MSGTNGGGRPRAFPRLRPAILTALVALAGPGCAPADPEADPPRRATATASPSHTLQSGMPDTADSLRLRLQAPDRVPRGQVVPFIFRVENISDRTLDLHLTGRRIAFDVVVERPDGTTAWRRLDHEVIQAILRLETLQPGQALVLETSWDQRSGDGKLVDPGEYRVRAELLTAGEPLRSPARPLRITPD